MSRKWKSIKDYEEIKFEFYEGIAKITINRPRYRNAFTPKTVSEMIDAMNISRENPEIEVIISDLEMPRMNGFELLSHIRQNRDLARKPVIVLTSRSAEKHRQLAYELGANSYLTKPYLEHEFLSTLESLANRNNKDTNQGLIAAGKLGRSHRVRSSGVKLE